MSFAAIWVALLDLEKQTFWNKRPSWLTSKNKEHFRPNIFATSRTYVYRQCSGAWQRLMFRVMGLKLVGGDGSLTVDFRVKSSKFQQILKLLGLRFIKTGGSSTLDVRVRGFCV